MKGSLFYRLLSMLFMVLFTLVVLFYNSLGFTDIEIIKSLIIFGFWSIIFRFDALERGK
jgi:hypothetical protein